MTLPSVLYLVNRNHVYFEVRQPIDVPSLLDVAQYPTPQAMHQAVSDATGEPLEDLENCSILLDLKHGEWMWCDSRGLWTCAYLEPVNNDELSIEQWISDLEI